jgi:predicted dehydrogenase
MMASGRLDVKPLISHRFILEQTEAAYAVVGGSEPSMGILLEYPSVLEKPNAQVRTHTVRLTTNAQTNISEASSKTPAVAFVGSGNYATGVLIPAFKDAGAKLATVASSAGVSGVHAGKKYGFDETTTDTASLFSDPKLDALVIATRHNSHAQLVLQALAAGKHVFVEKPICLSLDELAEIEAASRTPIVMVGFNRRFAPHVQKVKALLAGVQGPKSFVVTVNAGAIPADHWAQDGEVGGGRIIGEACHFIDLLRFLCGTRITSQHVMRMDTLTNDSLSISLGFEGGSIGTVHYLANGSKAFPKERLEVFAAGRVLQLDNFRKLQGFGWPGFNKMNLWRQDKGQKACAAAFIEAIAQGGPAPIPFEESVEVARVSIEVAGAA